MREPFDMKLKDGTTFPLRYSFKAIRFFEKLTGQHFFGDTGSGRIGADYLAAGIAAGLLWRNPHIKTDDIDAAIERHMDAGGDLPDLVESLMEALKKGGILKPDAGAEDKENSRPTMPVAVVAK